MSTTIRLALFGKKNQPIYRIVVAETRSKRNGKYLDNLGSYNPNLKPEGIIVDQGKLNDWVSRGAIISRGLRTLLKK